MGCWEHCCIRQIICPHISICSQHFVIFLETNFICKLLSQFNDRPLLFKESSMTAVIRQHTKKIFISLFALGLFACSQESGTNENTEPSPNQEADSPAESLQLEQFTPQQADWSTFEGKPFTNPDYQAEAKSHAPDSGHNHWINWDKAQWDGTTIYNPLEMDKQQFAEAICPHVDTIRGLKQLYDAKRPFADELKPTRAEVDEWHRLVINHIRALVGYIEYNSISNDGSGKAFEIVGDRTYEIEKDRCLFAKALWGQERKMTDMWDAKYPGTQDSAKGPCSRPEQPNPHCGATFRPDAADQQAYLPEGHAECTGAGGGSEGIFSGSKSGIVWSIKVSRSFCNTLYTEGFWGGHVGPWFHRKRFGFSFWDAKKEITFENAQSVAVLRAKWGGEKLENRYPQ